MIIIQTNCNIINGIEVDFQSRILEIKNQNWEEFKDYIISNEPFTCKIVNSTMYGTAKPTNCIIEKLIINDEFHLEVELTNRNHKTRSKYYLVDDENFNRFVSNWIKLMI